jgi:hypothetical protein
LTVFSVHRLSIAPGRAYPDQLGNEAMNHLIAREQYSLCCRPG